MLSSLAFIRWNVNPTAFSLFGLEIRWYGVLFSMALLASYLILDWMFKKEKQRTGLVDSLLWYMVIAVVLGARLGHCLFYEGSYYLTSEHWSEIILGFRDGGLASHGAAIALLIAIGLAAKRNKLSYWYLMDRMVVVVAISGFLIRTGNLMNSEIYGHATSLPWGFLFVRNGELIAKHPTQIYEALSYLLLFFALLWYYLRKKGQPKVGILSSCFLIVCFGMRFLIEFVKEVQESWENDFVLNMGQMLSLPFVMAGVVLLWLSLKGRLPYSDSTNSAPKDSKADQ